MLGMLRMLRMLRTAGVVCMECADRTIPTIVRIWLSHGCYRIAPIGTPAIFSSPTDNMKRLPFLIVVLSAVALPDDARVHAQTQSPAVANTSAVTAAKRTFGVTELFKEPARNGRARDVSART